MTTAGRLRLLRKGLRDRGCDCFLATSPATIRYLSGFAGSNGLLVVTPRSAWVLSDARYTAAVHRLAPVFRPLVVEGGLIDALEGMAALRNCRTAAVEEDSLTLARYRRLRHVLRGLAIRDAGDVVKTLAAVKDEREISALRKAARIADQVFAEILPLLRPGIAECEVAAEIVFRMRRLGSEGEAFETLVSAGARSAHPHAHPTRSPIRHGDTVVLDFGCRVEGYGSDLTRTVAIGRAGRQFRSLYSTVGRAQEAALDMIKNGVPASAVDAAAREVIAGDGWGRNFVHSLGHGLGLQIHELPRLAPKSSDILRTGNVATVEPGVYLPGRFGIRIEDDVLVQARCGVLLTTSSRELMVL